MDKSVVEKADLNGSFAQASRDFACGFASNLARKPLSTVFYLTAMPVAAVTAALTLAGIHDVGPLREAVSPHAHASTQSLLALMGVSTSTATAMSIQGHIERGRELREKGTAQPLVSQLKQSMGDFARGLTYKVDGNRLVLPLYFAAAGGGILATQKGLEVSASSSGFHMEAPIVTAAAVAVLAPAIGLHMMKNITEVGEFIRENRVRGEDGKWSVPTNILKQDDQGYVHQVLNKHGFVETTKGKDIVEDLQNMLVETLNKSLEGPALLGKRMYAHFQKMEIEVAREALHKSFVAYGHITAEKVEEMLTYVEKQTAFPSANPAPAPAPSA